MFFYRKTYLYLVILLSINYINCSLKFNIPSHRDKCFQQELYVGGAIQVRYDLSGYQKYYKGKEVQDLFKNIKIFIKNQAGKIIYETNMKDRKDKFVVHIKEADIYYICAKYFKPYKAKEIPGDVLMGLKIRNDYQYKKLEESLHKEDVNNFWKKIREIKRDMTPTIEASRLEIKAEDKTAKSIISSIDTYYILCCVQLVIIVIVTIFTIVSYKDFFKTKSII